MATLPGTEVRPLSEPGLDGQHLLSGAHVQECLFKRLSEGFAG